MGSFFVLADRRGLCRPYSPPVGNLGLLRWFEEELDVWSVLAGSISVDKMLVGISHGSHFDPNRIEVEVDQDVFSKLVLKE